MRMSQEEKDRSHARIIASAAKLVRQHGVDGSSVHDVMKDAGLTHGGFYKHFESKDALLAAALDTAFDEISAMLQPRQGDGGASANVAEFQAFYLSDGHVASPAIGCPVAALSGDIARGAIALKAHFADGVRRIVTLLARGKVRLRAGETCPRRAAARDDGGRCDDRARQRSRHRA